MLAACLLASRWAWGGWGLAARGAEGGRGICSSGPASPDLSSAPPSKNKSLLGRLSPQDMLTPSASSRVGGGHASAQGVPCSGPRSLHRLPPAPPPGALPRRSRTPNSRRLLGLMRSLLSGRLLRGQFPARPRRLSSVLRGAWPETLPPAAGTTEDKPETSRRSPPPRNPPRDSALTRTGQPDRRLLCRALVGMWGSVSGGGGFPMQEFLQGQMREVGRPQRSLLGRTWRQSIARGASQVEQTAGMEELVGMQKIDPCTCVRVGVPSAVSGSVRVCKQRYQHTHTHLTAL